MSFSPEEPDKHPKDIPLDEPVLFDELPFWRRLKVIVQQELESLSVPNRIGLSLALVILALAPLFFALKPTFKRWKKDNAIQSARQFWKSGNLAAANAAYQQATKSSDSFAHWQEYALFLDDVHAPNAADAWQQAVSLNPQDPQAQSGWIHALLAAGRPSQALTALSGLPSSLQQDPLLLITRAQTDLFMGRKADAAAAFRQASLSSASLDEHARLELAVLAEDVGDPVEQAHALETLGQFAAAKDPGIKIAALRTVMAVAGTENLRIQLLDAATQLADLPDANFGDRLVALQVLLKLRTPAATTALADLQAAAASNPLRNERLMRVLLDTGNPDLAHAWLVQLISQGASPEIIARLNAEINLRAGDWNQLEKNLNDIGLSGGNPDLIHTLLSAEGYRSMRPVFALDHWKGALRQIRTPGELLDYATRIATQLQWEEAWEAALKRAIELDGNDSAALKDLTDYYQKKRDLSAFFEIITERSRLEPENQKLHNMVLLCRLILQYGNPTTDLAEADQLRRDNPGNTAYATTYALALYRANRVEEAAEVFGTMSWDALENPERAVYYGMVLAALNRKTEAAEILRRAAASDDRFFPEVVDLRKQALESAESKEPAKPLPAPIDFPVPTPADLSY